MDLLKLIALDAEDLSVISAHAQDSVTKVGDLAYQAADRRFVVPIHRFVWEIDAGRFRKPHNERRNSVLHFDGVSAVRASGVNPANKNDVLSLLTISFMQDDAPSGSIDLVFAGGATVRLAVDYIEARLTDLGGAWEASSRPRHGV